MNSLSGSELKSVIEKIERLEEEKSNVAEWIRDAYLEAKVQGFDPKILRQIVKMRRMKQHERIEQEELISTYWSALENHGEKVSE